MSHPSFPHPESTHRSAFTLFELLIAMAILAFFLMVCSKVAITTISTRNDIHTRFSYQKSRNLGWHVIYQDLSYAVGIYYLDGTVPSAAPNTSLANKIANAQTNKNSRRTSSFTNTHDLLFKMTPGSSTGEPLVSIITSQGRKTLDDYDIGFREIGYFTAPHPDGEGVMILRRERRWNPSGSSDDEKEDDLLSNYRRHMLIDGIDDIRVSAYNGEEWVEEWDSLLIGDLPLAIRFEFRDLQSDSEEVRTIPIPISNLELKEPREPL
ncbi:MAG: prepilin-type N-terminal cleavage/methylation domain-containing protein [Planctomycetes bacterium]|nr:prepilin-type N-terminal cleavage/methylation domain-containing protein [Planctomycetota bacterium]